MRSKKVIKNSMAGFLYVLTAVICELIIPRLILGVFGSKYNGITSSITQFLSCIALMKAGIAGVSRAALIKALAQQDIMQVSTILKTTQSFLRKVAGLFVVFIVAFSIIYSYFMADEFGMLFTASLILIIGISTFGEYYFGLAYENLLNADQRLYVVFFIKIGTTVLNAVVAACLIYAGAGIHAVKLGSALAFLLNPLLIRGYARKHYPIHDHVREDPKLLEQRWDAFAHEVAHFVNTNTDIMVLTVFTNVLEVSVYTVYNTVIAGIRRLVINITNGFGSAFGEMYAKGEMMQMKQNFKIYELIVFSMATIIFSTTAVMLVPYAVLYTKGVTDVEYARPLFAYVITVAGAFAVFRIPYQFVVTTVGHFKQTKNGAFAEAIINITISVLAVVKFGLVGVAIGTVAANVFRTIQYAAYLSKTILKRSIWLFVKHLLVFCAVFIATSLVSGLWVNGAGTSVTAWIMAAAMTGSVALILTVATDLLLYWEDCSRLLGKLKYVFFKKSGN